MIEQLKELINIGLDYNDIDYTYLLEDMKKIIDGQQINIDVESYLN